MVLAPHHCSESTSAKFLLCLVAECQMVSLDHLVESFLGIESMVVYPHCVPSEASYRALVRLGRALIGAYTLDLAQALVCVLPSSHQSILGSLPLHGGHLRFPLLLGGWSSQKVDLEITAGDLGLLICGHQVPKLGDALHSGEWCRAELAGWPIVRLKLRNSCQKLLGSEVQDLGIGLGSLAELYSLLFHVPEVRARLPKLGLQSVVESIGQLQRCSLLGLEVCHMTLLVMPLEQGRQEFGVDIFGLVDHVIETLHHWHLFLSDLLVGLESYERPRSLGSD